MLVGNCISSVPQFNLLLLVFPLLSASCSLFSVHDPTCINWFFAFNFPNVNFPFICSNIPAAPVYGIYISLLIRCSLACGFHHDFFDRGLLLAMKISNQGFLVVKLKSSLRKFHGLHHDLIQLYGGSVSQMTTNMCHLS